MKTFKFTILTFDYVHWTILDMIEILIILQDFNTSMRFWITYINAVE